MAHVEFESEDYNQLGTRYGGIKGGLIGIILKLEVVKTEQQANIFLIGLVIVSLLIIFYFSVFKNRVSNDLPPPNIIIEQPEN